MRHKSILLAGFIGGDCRFPLHLSVCLSVCLSHFKILRFWCLSSAYCYNAIVTFGKTMRTLQCCLPTQGLNGSGCVMSWLCYLCSLLCNYYRSQYIYFTYSKKKRNALNLIFMNWCALFYYFKGEYVPSPPKKRQLRQCSTPVKKTGTTTPSNADESFSPSPVQEYVSGRTPRQLIAIPVGRSPLTTVKKDKPPNNALSKSLPIQGTCYVLLCLIFYSIVVIILFKLLIYMLK